MIRGEAWYMLRELLREGLSVSEIARRTGHDRKTIRKYIERGLEPPVYKPREPSPSLLAPYEAFLRERVERFPELTGRRLWREVRELGFEGAYSTVTEFLRGVRPPGSDGVFERRFETPPGRQAQVDFAFFKTRFTDEVASALLHASGQAAVAGARVAGWPRFARGP